MRLDSLIHKIKTQLSPKYGDTEAQWMVRTIFENIKNWNQVDLLIRGGEEVSDYIVEKVDGITQRLLADEPIQYIFESTYWHGLTLKVSPDVLIPRPETSELVDVIERENPQSDLAVLDLCTGSGCIAVALALSLKFAQVMGVDISEKALEIAKENAKTYRKKIEFIQADVLKEMAFPDEEFDIIVSNPPYIADSEAAEMPANVLEHEPHIALFVPDTDPLRFYRAIASSAKKKLKDGGRLYFEINPVYSAELQSMLADNGWNRIRVERDMYGRERFAIAIK